MFFNNVYIVIILFTASTSSVFGFEKLIPDFNPNYAPETSAAEAGLWMEFNDYESQLKYSPVRIKNIELDNYLKDVLCKLSPEYCKEVRMYVVRNPLFNASMAPNGMMQIYTGFLLRVRNEAQLASVLGHEMGHYLKRHSVKSFEDVSSKSSFLAFLMLGVAGAVATGNMNPDVGRASIDLTHIGLTGSVFSYSRNNEREADKYGIQLLHNADLDINEAKEIWVNLTEEKEAADENPSAGFYFYSTHPDPGERIKNLESHAMDIGKNEKLSTNKNTEIYWKNVKPILPILLEDELNLRQFKQTEYLFKKLLQNDVSPGLVHFYLGELYRLKKGDKDEYLIKRHYEESIRQTDHPPEVYRALGLQEYKAHNFAAANKYFDNYLELNPDAHDREMIEFYKNTGE